jgi:hypothetical protein
MWVELSDGRALGVPYAWFPRLLNASKKQREAVEIGRSGLHWEAIDEDISIEGLIAGRRDQTAIGAIGQSISSRQRTTATLYEARGRNPGRTDLKKEDQLFVERRPEGDYAVRRGNSERASAVLPTQAKAISRARELNPDSSPLVERVRKTDVGTRDKWRKA